MGGCQLYEELSASSITLVPIWNYPFQAAHLSLYELMKASGIKI